MKIYLVSMTALKDQGSAKDFAGFHIPLLLIKSSIEEAAEKAKEVALIRFPKSKGYFEHNAVIIPITKEILEALELARKEKINFDISDEPEMPFNFDNDLDSEIIY